jgi:hypothetical protein
MEELGRAYFNNHNRVRAERASARMYKCMLCQIERMLDPNHPVRQAKDWAHLHDTDPAFPANYIPACRSCHLLYDHNARWGNPEYRKLKAEKSRRHWTENREARLAAMPQLQKGRKKTPEHIAKITASRNRTLASQGRLRIPGRWGPQPKPPKYEDKPRGGTLDKGI